MGVGMATRLLWICGGVWLVAGTALAALVIDGVPSPLALGILLLAAFAACTASLVTVRWGGRLAASQERIEAAQARIEAELTLWREDLMSLHANVERVGAAARRPAVGRVSRARSRFDDEPTVAIGVMIEGTSALKVAPVAPAPLPDLFPRMAEVIRLDGALRREILGE